MDNSLRLHMICLSLAVGGSHERSGRWLHCGGIYARYSLGGHPSRPLNVSTALHSLYFPLRAMLRSDEVKGLLDGSARIVHLPANVRSGHPVVVRIAHDISRR